MSLRTTLALVVILACTLFTVLTRLSAQDPPQSAAKVTVDSNGAVQIPGYTVPLSSFLSPEAKAYVAEHLRDMQNPELLKQDQGVPRFMKQSWSAIEAIFAVERKDASLGGVHTYTYAPRSGISERNKARVLINLHGGGFSGCWPACAELESIPISALMKIKVVTVDYREGPDNKFPAASEDVASVYRELLKTYKPQNIGHLRMLGRRHVDCHVSGVVSNAWTSVARSRWHLLCVRGRIWRRRDLYSLSVRRRADASHAPSRPITAWIFQRGGYEGSPRLANEFTRDPGEVSADFADYRDQGLRDERNDPHGYRAGKAGASRRSFMCGTGCFTDSFITRMCRSRETPST